MKTQIVALALTAGLAHFVHRRMIRKRNITPIKLAKPKGPPKLIKPIAPISSIITPFIADKGVQTRNYG